MNLAPSALTHCGSCSDECFTTPGDCPRLPPKRESVTQLDGEQVRMLCDGLTVLAELSATCGSRDAFDAALDLSALLRESAAAGGILLLVNPNNERTP